MAASTRWSPCSTGKVKYFHNVSAEPQPLDSAETGGHEEQSHGLRSADSHHLGRWLEAVQPRHHQHCGYAGSSDPRVHFGLGASKTVKEIDILWPSRIHQVLRNVPADQILTVKEPNGR